MGMGALLGATAANATELCVKCSGPDASYACVIDGMSSATVDTMPRLYCITALAKAGGHASCAVDRSMTAPCPGERKELPTPAMLNDPGPENQPPHGGPDLATAPDAPAGHESQHAPSSPMPAGPAEATDQQPHDQPKEAAANEPPPKTVQEMVEKSAKSAGAGLSDTQKSAGEAAKSAGTALGKAGEAIGGAAKNSWKCLASFFSNCGTSP